MDRSRPTKDLVRARAAHELVQLREGLDQSGACRRPLRVRCEHMFGAEGGSSVSERDRDWLIDELVRHGQPVDDDTIGMAGLLLADSFGSVRAARLAATRTRRQR